MNLVKRHIVFFIAVVLGLLSPTQHAYTQFSQAVSQGSTTLPPHESAEFNYIVKHVFSVAAPVSDFRHKFIEELETPEEEILRKKAPASQYNSAFNTTKGFKLTFLHTPPLTKRSSTYGRFFYVHYKRIIRFCTLLI